MNYLAQVLNFNVRPNMKHDIGKYKLNQKKKHTESSFAVQLSTNVRCILHVVLFHVVNAIGKMRVNVLAIENCKV